MSYFLPRSDEGSTRGEELSQGNLKMAVHSIVVRKFREGGELKFYSRERAVTEEPQNGSIFDCGMQIQ